MRGWPAAGVVKANPLSAVSVRGYALLLLLGWLRLPS